MEDTKITQYYSKWRKCWVYFTDGFGNRFSPNKSEIYSMKKYKYKLK